MKRMLHSFLPLFPFTIWFPLAVLFSSFFINRSLYLPSRISCHPLFRLFLVSSFLFSALMALTRPLWETNTCRLYLPSFLFCFITPPLPPPPPPLLFAIMAFMITLVSGTPSRSAFCLSPLGHGTMFGVLAFMSSKLFLPLQQRIKPSSLSANWQSRHGVR